MKDLDLACFSVFVSDSVPLDTSTDIGSDPRSSMNALTSLRAPSKSSLLVCEKIRSAHNAFFEVPARQKGQKPILFRQIEIGPVACESSEGSSESPQFFYYGQRLRHMMERMGYDFTKESDLNFGKRKRALLRSFVPKDKDPNYYHKT